MRGIRLLAGLVLAFGVLDSAGCKGGDADGPQTPEQAARAAMTQDQKKAKMIEDIKNNPHMPQNAKDAAIGALGGQHMK
jgi:hypothetical protein